MSIITIWIKHRSLIKKRFSTQYSLLRLPFLEFFYPFQIMGFVDVLKMGNCSSNLLEQIFFCGAIPSSLESGNNHLGLSLENKADNGEIHTQFNKYRNSRWNLLKCSHICHWFFLIWKVIDVICTVAMTLFTAKTHPDLLRRSPLFPMPQCVMVNPCVNFFNVSECRELN